MRDLQSLHSMRRMANASVVLAVAPQGSGFRALVSKQSTIVLLHDDCQLAMPGSGFKAPDNGPLSASGVLAVSSLLFKASDIGRVSIFGLYPDSAAYSAAYTFLKAPEAVPDIEV